MCSVAENEYRTLEKYLLEWEPAVASPYKIDTDGPSTGTSAVDVNQPVQVGVSHNKGIIIIIIINQPVQVGVSHNKGIVAVLNSCLPLSALR